MDYNQNNIPNQNPQYFNPYGYNQNTGYNPNNMNNPYNPNGQNPYYNAPQQNMNAYYGHMPYGVPNNAQNSAQNYFNNQQRFLRLREQKNELRKYSTVFAITMLSFLFASYIISFILSFGDLKSLYENNSTFSASIGIFYSIFAVGLPFFIANKYLSKNKLQSETAKTIYSAPKNPLKTISLIFVAVLGCIGSMYISGLVTVFFNAFGYDVSAGGEPNVKSVMDIVALFVGTAIIPPLVEEFAMRNVLMQSLRKYGNLFAVLASAFSFGIFHGTPAQIPFAFLCGLFIGYAVIATESIWTGVIIHAIVNGISCVYYAAAFLTDEDTGDTIYSAILGVLAILGVIGLIFYISEYRTEFSRLINFNGLNDYTNGQKLKKFIFTPMMIIAIIVFIIQAIGCITPMTDTTV